ncbi:hypothetical protein ACFPMF_03860 [Larkinella bovis]|uniref:Uncharacterized protein n=1 Tax=Larkinella bovis TaxID=683041 RepID=A0ABW0I4Y6_9BACT
MAEYSFKNLEIRYQTALVVPPPFAHFFTIELRIDPENRLGIRVAITYAERDELEEDEIIAEGFTIHDDYQWSGVLPAVWLQTVDSLVRKTQLKPFDEEKLTDNQEYFQVRIEKDSLRTGMPSQRVEWQFISQELIQAVYEVSGKEKPFEITYLEIEGGNRIEAQLTASFGRREAKLENRRNTQNRTTVLPWKEVKAMMEIVYGVDYDPETALSALPRKPGRYLNLGTSEWFDLTTAVVGENDAISKLNRLLARLVQA